MKRVFIIHGWGGSPEEAWMPWLRQELKKLGVEVYNPAMPDTDNPKIETWVPFLAEQVGTSDQDTYLVGHSIGCQTIMRYLQSIDVSVGGVVFVAGWFTLMNSTPDELPIREPWISTLIDYEKVKKNTSGNIISIFSNDDDVVPLENVKFFEERLSAKTYLETGKGHFSGSDGITELPIVLEELKKMMNL